MTHVLARGLVAFVLIVLAATGRATADDGPEAIIATLHRALLETMRQSATLDAKARYAALAPVVGATYDFERMVGIIAGPAWSKASEEQRQTAVEAFRRFSVANYAARFKGYSGERFEMAGERPSERERIIVETRLIRSDGPPVSINYVFERRGDRWRAIDVHAERAISELALRRSEFAQTLKEGGLPALTDVLNGKADEMLAG